MSAYKGNCWLPMTISIEKENQGHNFTFCALSASIVYLQCMLLFLITLHLSVWYAFFYY